MIWSQSLPVIKSAFKNAMRKIVKFASIALLVFTCLLATSIYFDRNRPCAMNSEKCLNVYGKKLSDQDIAFTVSYIATAHLEECKEIPKIFFFIPQTGPRPKTKNELFRVLGYAKTTYEINIPLDFGSDDKCKWKPSMLLENAGPHKSRMRGSGGDSLVLFSDKGSTNLLILNLLCEPSENRVVHYCWESKPSATPEISTYTKKLEVNFLPRGEGG